MFRERIIVQDSLVADESGSAFRIRLPWYRALPLSTIEELSVTVDGTAFDPARLRIAVNDGEWALAEAQLRTDDVWFVLDDATVRLPGLVLDAGAHEVQATLSMRIPYLPVAGKPLSMAETDQKRMDVKELTA
uniref:3'-dehydrocarminate deglycosidase beta subunit n=1 Tax=Microbacterium sp. TaxID=51671 RepID=CGDB_MICSX|nr:C-glucoside lyase beta subunit [Microbacterium sp.]